MCEKTARDQGKNHPKGLKRTIPGAHTRLGIVPIPHQPDKKKKEKEKKNPQNSQCIRKNKKKKGFISTV